MTDIQIKQTFEITIGKKIMLLTREEAEAVSTQLNKLLGKPEKEIVRETIYRDRYSPYLGSASIYGGALGGGMASGKLSDLFADQAIGSTAYIGAAK